MVRLIAQLRLCLRADFAVDSVYNSANGLVYVSNAGSNTVSILNTTTNSVVGTIPVGAGPNGIAYNQDNGKVYVANSVSGTISVINGSSNTVSNTIPVGKTPIGLGYNPINNSIYVASLIRIQSS